jgi:flagellar protein FliO/FliZ
MEPLHANAFMLFLVILVLIPACLWLLKRTPIGGGSANSLMRSVAILPLSPNQRIVTIEVGLGADKRWLVLGVTPQQITTLHTMEPQLTSPTTPTLATPGESFNQLMGKLLGKRPGKQPGADQ